MTGEGPVRPGGGAMRIAIIGAGAMGSLFGAMLSGVSEVCLVDPYVAHRVR